MSTNWSRCCEIDMFVIKRRPTVGGCGRAAAGVQGRGVLANRLARTAAGTEFV